VAVLIGLVAGLIWQSLIGGDRRRRLLTFVISGVATAGVLLLMSAMNWFLVPGLGPVVMIILIAATVIGVTALISGLQNRRALISAAIAGAVSLVCYFALQPLFDVSTIGTIVILAIVAIIVSLAIGWFVGGYDRGQNMRISVIVTIVSGFLIIVDRFMQAWPQYFQDTNGRPIATVGSSTPGLEGDMWVTGLDTFTHLVLPTIALLLISFASYTRYSRAGMLEVLNQDFIRTARAKGLPERTVVVRHAFRNMLIPITTLVAFDVGALLGGAVITERVFAIPGMGSLFNLGLSRGDLNPVMAYFLVIAAMAILFNFLADLAYAALDPRVRVR
jgi:peptide/nickel transport system permease protein